MDWGYILVGVLGAIGGIIVAIINANANAQKTRAELREGLIQVKGEIATEIAVTNAKLEQIERKQDKHNQYIERTYKLEESSALQDAELKRLNRRIEILEKGA